MERLSGTIIYDKTCNDDEGWESLVILVDAYDLPIPQHRWRYSSSKSIIITSIDGHSDYVFPEYFFKMSLPKFDKLDYFNG